MLMLASAVHGGGRRGAPGVVPVRSACSKLGAMLRAAKEDEDDTYKLFVGNLPWSIDGSELEELFSHFGEVQDIQVHA